MARVLLIDDDDTVRSAMARAVALGGHEVLQARDGRQAIREAEGRELDLVITDINMPEMDGIEVILTLAERRPGLPVIAVSGGGRMPKEVLLSSAGILGAVKTLGKPFDLAEFRKLVEDTLSETTES